MAVGHILCPPIVLLHVNCPQRVFPESLDLNPECAPDILNFYETSFLCFPLVILTLAIGVSGLDLAQLGKEIPFLL